MNRPQYDRTDNHRERGAAMLLVIIFGVGLLFLTVLSLDMTKSHAIANRVSRESFTAQQIAESAAAQALAQIKQAGIIAPDSGNTLGGSWVPFCVGDLYYYTQFDPINRVSTVRAWGRVPVEPNPSASTAAPDGAGWDSSGYMVRGLELSVRSLKFIPDYPLYFGNGGVERPMGGFEWIGGSDPADPTTWGAVSTAPDSWQAASIPFEVNALDHPVDYIYNGGSPTPPSAGYHPYQIWAAQTPIGQVNIDAWFANSAGTGNDPWTNVTPDPTSSAYSTDPTSTSHPYPVDPGIHDVQSFAWELWNTFGSSGASNVVQVNEGTHFGEFGDLANPVVMFCTGKLTVKKDETLRGSGILVIRDDYDPNVHSNNTPSARASLQVEGNMEWTGLVIVAGWAPNIHVKPSGSATIVGSIFGEDSVQSGAETSLDSATIILVVENTMQVLYSRDIFTPGGLIHSLLPEVRKEIVGVREL